MKNDVRKSIKASIFAWIAATFFLAELIYSKSIVSKSFRFIARRSPALIVLWIVLAALIVVLALRTRIGVLAATAGLLLPQVLWLFKITKTYRLNLRMWLRLVIFSPSTYVLLACIALIVLLILSLARKRAVKFLWFIPFVLALLGCLIFWKGIRYNGNYLHYYWLLSFARKSITKILISNTLEALGLLFAGLWLMAMAPARSAAAAPYAPSAAGPAYGVPADGARNEPRYAEQPPAPAAGPKFCGKCGGRVVPGSPFCPGCGAPLPGPRT